MRAQCVLVATTLLHSGSKFHSFLYTGSKRTRVNMESCYGGMSTRLCHLLVLSSPTQYVIHTALPGQKWLHERASILRYTYIACLFVKCRRETLYEIGLINQLC